MKCRNCGFENTEEAKFCINCGKRIDGKILCPKCQTYIAPDSLNCPNCGHKIPHRHEEVKLPKEVTDRKNNIYKGFRKAFTIVSIVMFALAILAVITNYIPDLIGGIISNDMESIAGPTVLTWMNLSSLKSIASQSEYSMMWVTSIMCALSCLAVVAIVLIFSIKGLVSSVKALQDKSYKIKIMNIAVIYLTLVIGRAMINGFAFTYYSDGSQIAVDNWVSMNLSFSVIFMIFAVILFVLMFAVEMIFQTKRAYIADRIIFMAMFIFLLIVLGIFQDDYVRFSPSIDSNYYFSGNAISYFSSLMFSVSDVSFTSNNIALFVLGTTSFVFYAIEITILGFGFVYFLIRAFSSKNTLRSYRVPIYASIFASMIISTIMLPIGISSYYLHLNVSEIASLGDFSISNFVLMFILTGLAIASLVVYRSNVRKEKLMKLTSVEK